MKKEKGNLLFPHLALRTPPMLVLDQFLPRTKKSAYSGEKDLHFSRNQSHNCQIQVWSGNLRQPNLKQTIFISTMLLTRASIVDLLKHLHPSHFSIRMIYNGYTTCVRRWAMILKAVAKFRHIILYQEKRKPSSSETGIFERWLPTHQTYHNSCN